MLKEFKEFAVKGNVLDLAIAVVIGGAFGKIISSLVDDIIMPLVGALTGGINFEHLGLVLKEAQGEVPAVTLNYGTFIQSAVDFLIVAFSIFMFVKLINRFKREKEDTAVEEPPEEPKDILLLQEIRDLLKAKQ